jgi:hypothetical protein
VDADLAEHLHCVRVANRALCAALRRHEVKFPFAGGAKAKPWLSQVALVTHSGWEPGHSTAPRWGVVATVYFWNPGDGEYRLTEWAPTWREAIELAVGAALDSEP